MEDSDKTGTIKDTHFIQMMNKYAIKITQVDKRFMKIGTDQVDYLKFLKYYL